MEQAAGRGDKEVPPRLGLIGAVGLRTKDHTRQLRNVSVH